MFDSRRVAWLAVGIDLCDNELIKQFQHNQPMFSVLLLLVVIEFYLLPNAGSGVDLEFLPPALARPGRYTKTKATGTSYRPGTELSRRPPSIAPRAHIDETRKRYGYRDAKCKIQRLSERNDHVFVHPCPSLSVLVSVSVPGGTKRVNRHDLYYSLTHSPLRGGL